MLAQIFNVRFYKNNSGRYIAEIYIENGFGDELNLIVKEKDFNSCIDRIKIEFEECFLEILEK